MRHQPLNGHPTGEASPNGRATLVPPEPAKSWGSQELAATLWKGLRCPTGSIPRTAPLPQPSSKSSRLLDITEQRRTEVALALQSRELERANAELMGDYTGQ